MELIDNFYKQGGKKLLKQYWNSGALFTGIGEFLLLGRKRTALEILRLSTALKTKQKLEKKYRWKLEEFNKVYIEREHFSSNTIWICWFQGMSTAPEIVKKCYSSVVENNPDKEVIVITAENMGKYVTFPEYILNKWKMGVITHTHMTDLLRLELLISYGGLWLDATVLCTGKAPDYFFDSDLFFFQNLKPGRDGDCQYISSWLMEAKSNNKILLATRDLCFEYWKDNDFMWDYYLLHDFMAIVLDMYEDEWKQIIPFSNSTPHILLLRLFDQFDQDIWDAVIQMSPFHKLSYKFCIEATQMENTFYKKIMGEIIE